MTQAEFVAEAQFRWVLVFGLLIGICIWLHLTEREK